MSEREKVRERGGGRGKKMGGEGKEEEGRGEERRGREESRGEEGEGERGEKGKRGKRRKGRNEERRGERRRGESREWSRAEALKISGRPGCEVRGPRSSFQFTNNETVYQSVVQIHFAFAKHSESHSHLIGLI